MAEPQRGLAEEPTSRSTGTVGGSCLPPTPAGTPAMVIKGGCDVEDAR
jgi:hypothetical protein